MDRASLRRAGRARHRHLAPAAREGQGTLSEPPCGEHRMKHYIAASNPMRPQFNPQAGYAARHFGWHFEAGVGPIPLDRAQPKTPLTFQSYAELRDFFGALRQATDVKAVVLTGAGGNFCSGGDVHEIIGPLTPTTTPNFLHFNPTS